MEVCMQCHLETTSSPLPASIVRYERGPFSYRPGQPLTDFILHFDHAPGTGHGDKFEITGSVYRLRQSECFRKSNSARNGAMTCTTCHNPHDALRGDDAARHYTSVCRQCHGAALNRLVSAGAHTTSTDCTGCHMPKRRTDDVVHAVMTDHLIQRRKPPRDLLAPVAERRVEGNAYRGEVIQYYPLPTLRSAQLQPYDELYVAIAQVSQQSNLSAGIARLQAAIEKYHPERAEYYLQLGDALCNARRFVEAVPVYEEALRREPKSAVALERLALCLSSLKQYSRAEAALKQALEARPRRPGTSSAWFDCSKEQRWTRVRHSKRRWSWILKCPTPTTPPARSGSRRATRRELKPRCGVPFASIRVMQQLHNNLGNLLSASDRFEEARYHFEAALRFKENYNGGLGTTIRSRWRRCIVWERHRRKWRQFFEPIQIAPERTNSSETC